MEAVHKTTLKEVLEIKKRRIKNNNKINVFDIKSRIEEDAVIHDWCCGFIRTINKLESEIADSCYIRLFPVHPTYRELYEIFDYVEDYKGDIIQITIRHEDKEFKTVDVYDIPGELVNAYEYDYDNLSKALDNYRIKLNRFLSNKLFNQLRESVNAIKQHQNDFVHISDDIKELMLTDFWNRQIDKLNPDIITWYENNNTDNFELDDLYDFINRNLIVGYKLSDLCICELNAIQRLVYGTRDRNPNTNPDFICNSAFIIDKIIKLKQKGLV